MGSRILTAEAGNSFFKIRCDKATISLPYDKINDFLTERKIDSLLICNTSERDLSFLQTHNIFLKKEIIKTSLSYVYDFSQLGIDRIIASEYIFRKFAESFLLISFGSALTVNIVRNGVFEKGFIVPSKFLSFRCLSGLGRLGALCGEYTFPEIKAESVNTNAAILNGIELMERSFIQKIIESENDIPVFITGGDKYIPFDIFGSFYYSEHIVISGMEYMKERSLIC